MPIHGTGTQTDDGRVVDSGLNPSGTDTPLQLDTSGNLYVQTSVSLRTSAGGPAPGQALKQYTGKVALSLSATTSAALETVPAGKSFFITDIYLSHDTNVALDVRIQAGGIDIFRAPVKGDTSPVQLAGLETQPSGSQNQAVTILWPQVGGATNGYFFVSGFEQ